MNKINLIITVQRRQTIIREIKRIGSNWSIGKEVILMQTTFLLLQYKQNFPVLAPSDQLNDRLYLLQLGLVLYLAQDVSNRLPPPSKGLIRIIFALGFFSLDFLATAGGCHCVSLIGAADLVAFAALWCSRNQSYLPYFFLKSHCYHLPLGVCGTSLSELISLRR